MSNCCENKTNKHRLDISNTGITYMSCDMITKLSLPRVYTNSHIDSNSFIFFSVGHDINEKIFFDEEMKRDGIVGSWHKVSKCRSKNGYEIHFTADMRRLGQVLPLVTAVNKIYCEEFDRVLEAMGVAEYALIENNPKLGKTPIYINFLSELPQFNRKEYWGNLSYWICDSC